MEQQNQYLTSKDGNTGKSSSLSAFNARTGTFLNSKRRNHAKGAEALGIFTLTNDITRFSNAKLFSRFGQKTKIYARFREPGTRNGLKFVERKPIEFLLRFFMEEGNWDFIGNNLPVLALKDPAKYSRFVTPHPRFGDVNSINPSLMWSFLSNNPESMHQLMMLMSDRGTPSSYRSMNGFGCRPFSVINGKKEHFLLKFRLSTLQGIRNLTGNEILEANDQDPNHAGHDLSMAIEGKDFPQWALKMQVMTLEESKKMKYNPFDATKVWIHDLFPLIDVGIIELNSTSDKSAGEIPDLQNPSNEFNGIGYSNKKVPHNPDSEDYYNQPGLFFRHVLRDEEKNRMVGNIVASMGGISGLNKEAIIYQQLINFFHVDHNLAIAVEKGLHGLRKEEDAVPVSATTLRRAFLPVEK